MKKKKGEKEKEREKNKEKSKSQRAWIISITVCAFFLSVSMNLLSDLLMRRSDILAAFIILIAIVVIGIFFDIVAVGFHKNRKKELCRELTTGKDVIQ